MHPDPRTATAAGLPPDEGAGPEAASRPAAPPVASAPRDLPREPAVAEPEPDEILESDESDLLGEAADEISADIATISAQRDEYLAVAQRLQAEFENYKKRVGKELAEKQAAGKADLAGKLLAVLDACDSAIIQGVDGIGPIHKVLFETLTKEGLEVIEADDSAFDPNLHDAVMHEPGDDEGEPTVVETLRTGYLWKGRVLRPAMVKVRG
jgi:molecular chaperone GrpE